MAMKFSLFVIMSLLFVSSCSVQGKNWCMVTVSAPNNKLQQFLDTNCRKYDCKPINPGGSCYQPNNLQGHASYLLDVVYRATGTCDSSIGTPTVTDPSYGSCKYP